MADVPPSFATDQVGSGEESDDHRAVADSSASSLASPLSIDSALPPVTTAATSSDEEPLVNHTTTKTYNLGALNPCTEDKKRSRDLDEDDEVLVEEVELTGLDELEPAVPV